MALVRITPEAVARYCQDKEITSIARDKISDIIREVCNEVAAAVNSCPRNARIAMDSSSVPAELVFTTCILVRDAVTSSVPGSSESLQGTARAAQYQDARAKLRAVAACEVEFAPLRWAPAQRRHLRRAETPGLEQSDMKKTLKKSPVIAFAEVLCQRAVEICSAANNGEDPEIIIKAWDGSFEEEIKRVTGSLETVIVMERPEIVPDKLSRSGKSTARWHVTVESNPLLDGDGWDADDLADIIQEGFHKWRRNHARLMMTEVIVTSSKPALAKILKKSIVLTMETTLIIKHGN